MSFVATAGRGGADAVGPFLIPPIGFQDLADFDGQGLDAERLMNETVAAAGQDISDLAFYGVAASSFFWLSPSNPI